MNMHIGSCELGMLTTKYHSPTQYHVALKPGFFLVRDVSPLSAVRLTPTKEDTKPTTPIGRQQADNPNQADRAASSYFKECVLAVAAG